MKRKGTISEAVEEQERIKTCPNCGGDNISYTLALEEKPRSGGEGCFLGYMTTILLLMVPVIGWILLFAIYHEKRSTIRVTYALCNNCGKSWKVAQEESEKDKKSSKRVTILLIIFLILIFVAAIVLSSLGRR